MLETIMKRNLLKYAAGRQITCPSCGAILDYRTVVLAESPSGQQHINCAGCFRKGLALVHDDKPLVYLQSIGWQVTSLAKLDDSKPAKAKAMPKTKAVWNAWLRKAILAGHKAMGNTAKHDRLFPICTLDGSTQQTEMGDGTVDIGYRYPAEYLSNRSMTDAYVRQYCELNHLTA